MKRTSKTSKVCHDINNDIQSTSEHKLLVKGMKSSKNLSLGNISSFKMVVSLYLQKKKNHAFFQSKTTFFVTTPNSLKWNACTYYYLRDSNSWGWLCKKGRKWLQRLNNSEMQDFDCDVQICCIHCFECFGVQMSSIVFHIASRSNRNTWEWNRCLAFLT